MGFFRCSIPLFPLGYAFTSRRNLREPRPSLCQNGSKIRKRLTSRPFADARESRISGESGRGSRIRESRKPWIDTLLKPPEGCRGLSRARQPNSSAPAHPLPSPCVKTPAMSPRWPFRARPSKPGDPRAGPSPEARPRPGLPAASCACITIPWPAGRPKAATRGSGAAHRPRRHAPFPWLSPMPRPSRPPPSLG